MYEYVDLLAVPSYNPNTMTKPSQPKPRLQLQMNRAEDQTTMTFSLDKDLAAAVRARARGLRISVSGYLRMLADQDIGGGQILIAGPRSGSATLATDKH